MLAWHSHTGEHTLGWVRARLGGDINALRDADAVWGRLSRAGVSIIQTDEPEALLRFVLR